MDAVYLDGDNHNFRLSVCASVGYTSPMKPKDAGLRIRVERSLRDEFRAACNAQDRPAAQVIREFMRSFVETQAGDQRQEMPVKSQRNSEGRKARYERG